MISFSWSLLSSLCFIIFEKKPLLYNMLCFLLEYTINVVYKVDRFHAFRTSSIAADPVGGISIISKYVLIYSKNEGNHDT